MYPVSKQHGQLEVRPPGLAPGGWHNYQVSLACLFDAQVAVELAKLKELLVSHLDHRCEAQDQGWDLG
jgi:hypothetical protein